MGIKNLKKLIREVPGAIHEEPDWSGYRDKVLAVDASLCLLKKLIPWREHSKTGKGETEHLMKILYGSIRLLRHGVKPVFVFDGMGIKRGVHLVEKIAKKYTKDRLGPPGEEKKHIGLIAEAIQAIYEGKIVDTGYKNPTLEAKYLLRLLGIPYLEAPEEAEIQCAALVKSGKAYAAVTKKLDTLTFGSDRIIRHLSFKAKSKTTLEEIDLTAILKGLEINYTEFVDLCILLGCDYCDKMKHIGPKKTLELLQKYRSIENVLRVLDQENRKIPFFWTTLYPSYDEARKKFMEPPVYICEKLGFEWASPCKQEIEDYLCDPKQPNADLLRRKVNKHLSLI